jgi:hypothetical protein
LIDPSQYRIGYCTNVHAGRDFDSVCQNILEYSIPIRKLVEPEGKIGVGLWFSEQSASEALKSGRLNALKEILEKGGIVPFTLNGFPQGDFHSRVVKHQVYKPEWWKRERLEYTLGLIEILHQLLPHGEVGSISTLPISWGRSVGASSIALSGSDDEAQGISTELIALAANHLLEVANHLHQLFESTGRRIVLAIEPEPGCYLTDSQSFREFYTNYLSAPAISESQAHLARRYLTLCHDVCHAAVMFEDQEKELRNLKENGVAIGKVQVSSAIQATWDSLDQQKQRDALEQLSRFAEDRYLHQTNIRGSEANAPILHDDLPNVLRGIANGRMLTGEWRIHFHVPIYLASFGQLQSTQFEIKRLLELLSRTNQTFPDFTGHYEVETYAWSVLPESLQTRSLQEGIADELMWFLANLVDFRNA